MPLPPVFENASSPLDADDYAWLQDMLARGEQRGWFNVEAVDGYFAAMICAPLQASLGLRFGPVFGVEVFAEAPLGADAERVEDMLRRHWQVIAATLDAALLNPAVRYHPLLFEDDTGAVAGNDWALGFMRGMADDPAAWQAFERAQPGTLDAVRRLAAETAGGPPLADDERTAALAAIAVLLVDAFRHFEPSRG